MKLMKLMDLMGLMDLMDLREWLEIVMICTSRIGKTLQEKKSQPKLHTYVTHVGSRILNDDPLHIQGNSRIDLRRSR